MAPLPDIDPPLTDGTVVLRLSAERDIPEILIAHQDDPGLHLSLGEGRPPSGAQLGARQERAEAERLGGRRVSLTITEARADTCLGQVDARMLAEARRARLALWLAPGARGRGLGTRALRLAGDWLLGAAGCERVELLIRTEHAAMLRSAQAAGFRAEELPPDATPQPDSTLLARRVEAPER